MKNSSINCTYFFGQTLDCLSLRCNKCAGWSIGECQTQGSSWFCHIECKIRNCKLW